MSENSKNLELFHYGVKGMRWGVTRPTNSEGLAKGKPPGAKKQLKSDRDSKISAAGKKFEKAERDEGAEFESKRKANRAKGQGRIESRKNALKDLDGKHQKRMEEADQDLLDANRDYKQGRKNLKSARKAQRNDLRDIAKRDMSSVNKGRLAAETIVTASLNIGYRSARSSGASRVTAAANTILAGPAGGVTYRRLANR